MNASQTETARTIRNRLADRGQMITDWKEENDGNRVIVTVLHQTSDYILGQHCTIYQIGVNGGLSERSVY